MSSFILPKYSDIELFDLKTRMFELSNKIDLAIKDMNLNTRQGQQFYWSGVIWRLFLIRESYLYLTELFPPQRSKALAYEESRKASLYLNSFYLHIWGCIDNWAWVLAYEMHYEKLEDEQSDVVTNKGKINLFPAKKSRNQENLRNWIHRKYTKFDNSLSKFDKWIENLGELRHPAAHRIPLRVPPYIITSKNQGEEWNEREKESQGKIKRGIDENNIEHLMEAIKIMDSLGDLGQFFPIFAHELKFNEAGEFLGKSFNFLYPTIINDCEQFLSLLEECTRFLKEVIYMN